MSALDPRKEQDCVYFLQGRCLKGPLCPFRHDQTKAAPQQDRQPQQPAGDCFYFLQGRCNKGAMCPFKHDLSKQVSAGMAHGGGHAAEMFNMPPSSMYAPQYSLQHAAFQHQGPPPMFMRPPLPVPSPQNHFPMQQERLENPPNNYNGRDSEPFRVRSEQRIPSRLAGRLGPVADEAEERGRMSSRQHQNGSQPIPPPPHRSSARVVEVKREPIREQRVVNRDGGHASVHPRDSLPYRDSLPKRKRDGDALAQAHAGVGDFSKGSLDATVTEAVFEAPKSIAEIRKAKQQKKSDPVPNKVSTKPKFETAKPVQKAAVRDVPVPAPVPAPAPAPSKAPEPEAAPVPEVPEEEDDLPDMGDDNGLDVDDDDFEAQMRALEDAI